MVRKTALVTAMLSAYASTAYALGLGEIQLNSALNQPFDAEVAVRSATPQELDELNVVLASPEAYNRAGVDRIFLHTKLRFSVEERANGRNVIHITSQDPVREPYLDFLIEARWGSGQVVREYTVLIDPPVLMDAEAQPAPSTPATSASRSEPSRSRAAPAPAPAPRQAASFTGDEYGPTQRNDTLWKVAEKVRPRGASMEQTMLGLLEANPEAFINGNINNLKAGYVLRVPSREQLQSVAQSQAEAEVSRHHRLWRAGRTEETRTGRVERDSTASEPGQAQGGAAETAEASASQDSPKLKLVAPEETGAGASDEAAAGAGAGQGIGEVRQQLNLAVEELEAQRQQNKELNDRLAELEQQIAQLHRLVQLSDEELAHLQQSAQAQAAAGQSGETPPEQAGAEAPEPAADRPAGTQDEAGMQAATEAEQVSEAAAESASAAETQAEAAPPAPEPAPGPDVAASEAPAADERAPAEQEMVREPAGGEGLMSRFMTNPLWQIGAGAGALLLLVLGWLVSRRRRMEATEFQESILAEPKGRAAAAEGTDEAAFDAAAAADVEGRQEEAPAEAETAAQSGPQSDSSLFTDFAVSDMGAIQDQAEADPIAEADVYLAYGRYKQAEDLIRNAVDKEPERSDLRVKLLEIYFAAKNQPGFDAEAEALLANVDSQEDPDWKRVVEMGRELNPANPLYASGTAAAARASDEGPAEAETAAFAQAPESQAEPESGFSAEVEALDFDMDTLSEEPETGEQAPRPAAGATAEADAGTLAEDDNSLDFSLSGLESLSEVESSPEAEEKPAEDADNLLEFDLGETEIPETDAEDEALEVDDGALQSSDEVSTKLDLARAYIEMGDPEGAKSILDEVMEEGSDTQKHEAESLMREVG